SNASDGDTVEVGDEKADGSGRRKYKLQPPDSNQGKPLIFFTGAANGDQDDFLYVSKSAHHPLEIFTQYYLVSPRPNEHLQVKVYRDTQYYWKHWNYTTGSTDLRFTIEYSRLSELSKCTDPYRQNRVECDKWTYLEINKEAVHANDLGLDTEPD